MSDEQNIDLVDVARLSEELAAARESQASLTEHLRSLAEVDPAQPSMLPGWTVAHVLTHIARNADGHLSMLDGHPQYPHGLAGRAADIEAGATRPWDELVADVASTSARVDDRWLLVDDWSGTSEMINGTRPTAMLPFLRQREVEIHRCDLGLDYTFADLPSGYVRRELHLMGMLWKARKPMGMTPMPDAALELVPHERLAWLMGRLRVDGLPDAAIF